jgi:hypothetical protein
MALCCDDGWRQLRLGVVLRCAAQLAAGQHQARAAPQHAPACCCRCSAPSSQCLHEQAGDVYSGQNAFMAQTHAARLLWPATKRDKLYTWADTIEYTHRGHHMFMAMLWPAHCHRQCSSAH